jgi:hypothetical protein
MNPEFQLKNLLIDFKLGEINLFNADFDLWVSNIHFTRAKTSTLTDPNNEIFTSSILPLDSKKASGVFFSSYPTNEILPKLSLYDGRICYVPSQYRRFYTDLTGTFESYEAKFSAKSRANLKKKIRKFNETSGGKIQWSVSRTPDELLEFYKYARQISLKTYQEKLLDCGIPTSEEFKKQMVLLAAQDQARGYLLFLHGEPVAYVYCPIKDGVVIYHSVGYDSKFREHSPGTVLQYLLLENLFAEKKFRIFDFTEGEGPHKEFFSTDSIPCADVYFFNVTVRNSFLIGMHYLLMVISRSIVKVLKTIGVHQRVKEMFRFGR